MDASDHSGTYFEIEKAHNESLRRCENEGDDFKEFSKSKDEISFIKALSSLTLWSIPNIFIILINNVIPFLNVLFIGLSGDNNALISCGLGAVTLNIIFDSVDCGLMTGVDTLVSQAFGRKDLESCELNLNICRYLLILLMIPQGLIVFFEDSILTFLGQEAEISIQTRNYLIFIFPGYVFMMMFICTRRYLNCCGLNRPILIITGSTLVLHLIFLFFTVFYFKLGLSAVGICTSISFFFQYICVEIFTNSRKEREHQAKWKRIDKVMIDKVLSYLEYGFPGLIANLLAMFPFEILPIYSGWLGVSEIASNIILNNIISISATVMVGNSLGANCPNNAKRFVVASYSLSLIFALVVLTLIGIFNDYIVGFYTDDGDVIFLYKEVLALFLLFNVADFIYYISEGICIGMGYQKILVIFVFCWLWIIMLPVTYLVAFTLEVGYIGIWIVTPITNIILLLHCRKIKVWEKRV